VLIETELASDGHGQPELLGILVWKGSVAGAVENCVGFGIDDVH
jgi:hypothetical protein